MLSHNAHNNSCIGVHAQDHDHAHAVLMLIEKMPLMLGNARSHDHDHARAVHMLIE